MLWILLAKSLLALARSDSAKYSCLTQFSSDDSSTATVEFNPTEIDLLFGCCSARTLFCATSAVLEGEKAEPSGGAITYCIDRDLWKSSADIASFSELSCPLSAEAAAMAQSTQKDDIMTNACDSLGSYPNQTRLISVDESSIFVKDIAADQDIETLLCSHMPATCSNAERKSIKDACDRAVMHKFFESDNFTSIVTTKCDGLSSLIGYTYSYEPKPDCRIKACTNPDLDEWVMILRIQEKPSSISLDIFEDVSDQSTIDSGSNAMFFDGDARVSVTTEEDVVNGTVITKMMAFLVEASAIPDETKFIFRVVAVSNSGFEADEKFEYEFWYDNRLLHESSVAVEHGKAGEATLDLIEVMARDHRYLLLL